MFDLEQVIRERHSTRLFLPQPVPRALVEEALVLAQHAPSNSDIQPWHMVFASGPPRDRLVKALLEEAQRRPPNIPPLPEAFRHYRRELGAQVYGAMGIAREDKAGHDAAVLRNWEFFRAPLAGIVCMHRDLGPADALGVGMYLQTLLLALTARGLGTCVEVSIAGYPEIVRASWRSRRNCRSCAAWRSATPIRTSPPIGCTSAARPSRRTWCSSTTDPGLHAMNRTLPTPWKPTKAQLLAAHNKLVPDLAAKNLIVLFAGINPGLYTAAIGRHFGRPGNRFWPALHGGGFTPRLFSPFEESLLLDLKFGITNIVERATARADELTDDELRAGGQRLEAKVKRWRPTVVAFVGIGPYRIVSGIKDARVGLQKAPFGGSHAWVLPNPSGLNAHYQPAALAQLFGDLRLWAIAQHGAPLK